MVIIAVALEASDSPGRTWLDMLGTFFESIIITFIINSFMCNIFCLDLLLELNMLLKNHRSMFHLRLRLDFSWFQHRPRPN